METTLSLGLEHTTVLELVEHRMSHPASRVTFKVNGKRFGCYSKRVRTGRGRKTTTRGYCRALEAGAPARRRRSKRSRSRASSTRRRPSRSRAAVQRRAMGKQQSLFPWLKIHRRG